MEMVLDLNLNKTIQILYINLITMPIIDLHHNKFNTSDMALWKHRAWMQ